MAKKNKKRISAKDKENINKKPVISGVTVPFIKSYHAVPFNNMNEIPPVFLSSDNDLAVDNMKNDFDMTGAKLQNFRKPGY